MFTVRNYSDLSGLRDVRAGDRALVTSENVEYIAMVSRSGGAPSWAKASLFNKPDVVAPMNVASVADMKALGRAGQYMVRGNLYQCFMNRSTGGVTCKKVNAAPRRITVGKPPKAPKAAKPCPGDKIRGLSGRCVKRDGKAGRAALAAQGGSAPAVDKCAAARQKVAKAESVLAEARMKLNECKRRHSSLVNYRG